MMNKNENFYFQSQFSKKWTFPLPLFLIGLLMKEPKLNCMGGRYVHGRALQPWFAGLHPWIMWL